MPATAPAPSVCLMFSNSQISSKASVLFAYSCSVGSLLCVNIISSPPPKPIGVDELILNVTVLGTVASSFPVSKELVTKKSDVV